MGKKKAPVWLDRRIAALGPYLTLCLRRASYVSAMKHLNLPIVEAWVAAGKGATAHTAIRSNGDMVVVVCLRTTPRPLTEVIGMLAHEATHVWQHYAQTIGERHPGDEQEAYAIQAITQELVQSFFEQTKGGRYGKFPRSCE